MRRLAFVLILAMITIISCAKEKSNKTHNVISSDPYAVSTVTGYFNPNSQLPLEVEGVSYSVSPQTNTQIINKALQDAQTNRIQPLYENGQAKYRANMTVTRYLSNQQYGQQYNQQYNQQNSQPLSTILTVTSISFY